MSCAKLHTISRARQRQRFRYAAIHHQSCFASLRFEASTSANNRSRSARRYKAWSSPTRISALSQATPSTCGTRSTSKDLPSKNASMKGAVNHYLSVCAKRGEEPERLFSGKLNLRLGTNLHRAAALAAAAKGESLNNWLVQVVESAARQDRRRKDAPFTKRPAKRGRTKTSRERSK